MANPRFISHAKKFFPFVKKANFDGEPFMCALCGDDSFTPICRACERAVEVSVDDEQDYIEDDSYGWEDSYGYEDYEPSPYDGTYSEASKKVALDAGTCEECEERSVSLNDEGICETCNDLLNGDRYDDHDQDRWHGASKNLWALRSTAHWSEQEVCEECGEPLYNDEDSGITAYTCENHLCGQFHYVVPGVTGSKTANSDSFRCDHCGVNLTTNGKMWCDECIAEREAKEAKRKVADYDDGAFVEGGVCPFCSSGRLAEQNGDLFCFDCGNDIPAWMNNAKFSKRRATRKTASPVKFPSKCKECGTDIPVGSGDVRKKGGAWYTTCDAHKPAPRPRYTYTPRRVTMTDGYTTIEVDSDDVYDAQRDGFWTVGRKAAGVSRQRNLRTKGGWEPTPNYSEELSEDNVIEWAYEWSYRDYGDEYCACRDPYSHVDNDWVVLRYEETYETWETDTFSYNYGHGSEYAGTGRYPTAELRCNACGVQWMEQPDEGYEMSSDW